MAQTISLGSNRKDVSRVVAVGRSLYVLLPQKVVESAGLKRGDRLVIESDGRMIYAARIPFEELISRRRALQPVELRPKRAAAGDKAAGQ